MKLDEILVFLEGEQKAAQFIFDNFSNIEFIGAGPMSKVFRA